MVTDERTAFLTDDQRLMLRRLVNTCATGTVLDAHLLGAIGVALAEIAAHRKRRTKRVTPRRSRR